MTGCAAPHHQVDAMDRTSDQRTDQERCATTPRGTPGPSLPAWLAAGMCPSAEASLQRAEDYCRHLARTRYENFSIGSWLLPRHLRQPFNNFYAFCRLADDLADEAASPAEALRLLDWWEHGWRSADRTAPQHLVWVAIRRTQADFQIPDEPLHRLLSAFRQDQRKVDYESYDELEDYCRRSANPVGEVILRFADCCTAERLEYSDAICTGLQLANHWQDVAADWRRGRVYLPAVSRREHGVTHQMLAAQQPTGELRRLLAAEVNRARGSFDRGEPLVRAVPPWLAADVRLFIDGGRAALRAIERVDYDVWTNGRPRVSRFDRLMLIPRALWTRCRG
jgi:squalene synthase HpnC